LVKLFFESNLFHYYCSEFCQEQELLFVIMERGVRDLSAFLKDRAKRKDLRISTVEAFWRDMVEAVAAVHDEGEMIILLFWNPLLN
jgi:hypothetical protein